MSSEERVRLRADPTTKHLSFGDSTKVISSRWENLAQEEKTKLEVSYMCSIWRTTSNRAH
jgi:hypothetical protein